MNGKQKISLVGFFIGLAMILNLSIYSNAYTIYIVSGGFIIALSCALAYSLFQYTVKEEPNGEGLGHLMNSFKEEMEDKNWHLDPIQEEKPLSGYIIVDNRGTTRRPQRPYSEEEINWGKY